MRDYGKVAPQFWTGETGKALKAAGPEAVIVALYLMTSPHANMIGLYYLPKLYIAHETGLGMEGASKGLARCLEAGFCEYDEASEHVFVLAMARFQVGESLSANDNRCKGVENELSKVPKGALQSRFRQIYSEAFNLEKEKGLPRPSEGPPKPRAGAGAGTRAGKSSGASAAGSRLPPDWVLPDEWRDWAKAERPDLDIKAVAAEFADYWRAKAGANARKADWLATWRNWVRKESGGAPAKKAAGGYHPWPGEI